MAVAVYKSIPSPCGPTWPEPSKNITAEQPFPVEDSGIVDDDRPGQADIWNLIQSQKPPSGGAAGGSDYRLAPYVQRSSSLLSQKSLEICTESLGSETGSEGFSSDADADGGPDADKSSPNSGDEFENKEAAETAAAERRVPSRSFPPPLPSLSKRTVGPQLQMRPHRCNGRLVVEAVPMPSASFFRAQRLGGRLLLSFAGSTAAEKEEERDNYQEQQELDEEEQEQEMAQEEEEEEEVEVVDRGTMVEVKVSTQPQTQSVGGNATRVHRSALFINKFVVATPLSSEVDPGNVHCGDHGHATPPRPRRMAGSTTTAAAAAAAASAFRASSLDVTSDDDSGESKLLLVRAKRRRSKEELLHHMMRCGQLRRQLFIWEPWGIATSS